MNHDKVSTQSFWIGKAAMIVVMVILSLTVLLLTGCDDDSDTPTPSDYELKESSRLIAQEFVRNSPTFQFDGIDGSLQQIEGAVPSGIESWRFRYRFDSQHPGYGDRSSEGGLIEEMTHHEAEITVSKGEVTRAVMDNEWDMLDQKETNEWEWGDAGKQALYGIISVFVVLSLLTLLTWLAGYIIKKLEKEPGTADPGQTH